MIKNVNLIQNPADIQYDKYFEEYLLQALANLGQRIGIKGDGISYKFFTFNEICDNTTVHSTDDYIGYIRYVKIDDSQQYKAIFGLVDKETLTDYKEISESININDCLYFPNDLMFDIPVNGIDKYSKNSICINSNNELTFILAGKTIGSNDNDKMNTMLYYYKFDIKTNKLKYGAKLFYCGVTNNDNNMFCLINTVNKLYEDNNYSTDTLSDEYYMHIHIFNSSYLNEYKEMFENIFTFSNYAYTNDIALSIIKPEYEDILKLIHFEEDSDISYDSNSAISIIVNSEQNDLYYTKTLILKYNSNENQFIYLSDNQIENENIIEYFKNEYDINLSEELYELNEDLIHTYYNVFNYYNDKFYLETRSEFIKRILLKLYESISQYDYSGNNILYIPLDYQFHYICNSNNQLNIYYSTNSYVTFTKVSKLELDDFWKNNNNLIYDYSGINKVKCYNFEINYNTNDENLINSIYIKDIYTMPYINGNNNWSINDTDTKVQAIGKDAGNPNIILIYNNDSLNKPDEGSLYILNAITNPDKIKNADYEQRWVPINPALFENINDTSIECCAYIPKLTQTNFDYFKNSIILSLSNLNCLSIDNYKYNYKGTYILTIWHIKESNVENEYSFEYVEDIDSKYAVVLGSTVNILNETNDSSVGNLNDQDLLLLKAIITELGQQRLSISKNNWFIMKNKTSEEYYNSTDNTGKYLNDLNGIMQYNDTIEVQNNHVIHSQKSKYIEDLSNIKITNSLYPKYEISKQVATTSNQIINVLKTNTNNLVIASRQSKIVYDGNIITNAESLIEKMENEVSESTISLAHNLIYETSIKTNSNYNEYVFNSNVPSLDFCEVFNRNFNVLNRVNIISLDYLGNTYNAYIGTSYDENQKSTLHIGTTDTNINLGTETLMNEVDKTKFKKHDTLSLDFNEIVFNTNTSILSKKHIINQTVIDNITYYSINIPLIGVYSSRYDDSTKLFINLYDKNVWDSFNFQVSVNEFNEFKSSTNPSLGLSLNYIMKEYFNKNIDNYGKYIFNDIEKQTVNVNILNGEGKFGVSNKTVNDKYYYVVALKNSLHNKILRVSTEGYLIYCGFNANIMYYETSNVNATNPIMNIYISFN